LPAPRGAALRTGLLGCGPTGPSGPTCPIDPIATSFHWQEWPRRWLPPFLLIGLLDALATTAVGVGVTVADTALVAMLAALGAPLAVVLARLCLHEPLALHQWVGIASALAGLVLIASL